MSVPSQQRFTNRREAGRLLGQALARLGLSDPVVLALPRGGVPVGFEVAKILGAPLDLLLVRKIGAPGHPEYGIGAVVGGSSPQLVLNEEAMRIVQPSERYIETEKKRQLEEIERRRAAYIGDRAAVPVEGRAAVVVDDGIATGGTVRAALQALQGAGASRTVLAVPVAPRETIEQLRELADEIVCLHAPEAFRAVGLHYVDFEQTTDEEVVALLRAATPERGGPDAAGEEPAEAAGDFVSAMGRDPPAATRGGRPVSPPLRSATMRRDIGEKP
jgi:putative phosphoribosyl transferase